MKLPRPEEMSDFKRHLQDIRESQQDLERVFERGRRGGLWNPRDLREYNRAMSDYKRHLSDVERQHKAIERVKGDEGANIRARQAIGVKVGGDELRRYDKIVRKEKQLLRLKEHSTKELAKHERHFAKIEKSASRQEMRERLGTAGGMSGKAAAMALGAAGYGYYQMMAGAQLHTRFEMARGATEKLGGVFGSGYSYSNDPGPPGRQRAYRELDQRNQPDVVEGKFEGRRDLGSVHDKYGSGAMDAAKSQVRAQEEYRREERKKLERSWQRRTVAGEMAQYESYGMRLGYSIEQSHQMAQGGLRALPGNRLRDMKSNLAMARGYSIDSGTLSGYQSAARFGGYEGGAAQLNQQLIGAFTKGKFPRALMGEFLQALTQVSNTMATGGGVVNQRSAAHMLAVYGNAMGQGFRRSPQRTAQMLQSLHQGIGAPGGGDAGKAFVMRALGLGGDKSFLDIREAMDRGATPGNIRKILAYGMQNLGERDTLLGMREMFGVKIPTGRKLLAAYNRGDLSDAAIQAQVNIGKDADLGAAKNLRLGFKALELEKMAEKAQIAAKNVQAVTLAYNLQTTAASLTAESVGWLTSQLEGLLKTASKGARMLR